jgi:hypothetical protein
MSNAATQAAASATSGATTEQKYFDLHITGVGYLNRPREVPLKRGTFLAVEIAALRGKADEVEYTRFDCRVSGTEAQELIRKYKADVEAEKKVLVGFKIGDLYPTTFVYDKGERKGQTGVSLKSHLLRITFIKVDGQLVYQAPRENGAATAEHPEAPAEAAEAAVS